MEDPSSQLLCGASSWDYLSGLNGSSTFTFLAELSYVKHPLMRSAIETKSNFRQLMLRAEADLKFLKTVILEEWNKVAGDLDKKSAFYKKILPHAVKAKEAMHEGLPDMFHLTSRHILFDPDYSRNAREDERFNVYMRIKYRFLCNNYEFVRLLKESPQTPAIEAAIIKIDGLFDDALDDISKNVDFNDFEVIDVNSLAKAQLGSGLIALNSVLENYS